MQGLFDEEDATFTQNGIIVEPKYDLTEQEKMRERQIRMQRYQDAFWQPSNISEFFFCDENGCPNITSERVKTLF